MTTEQKSLAKKRRASNIWMLLILAVTVALYRFTPEILAFLSGTRPEEVADIGIEALQKGFIAMFFLPWAASFAAMMASFIEPQLKENAFGSASRWGILFLLFCLGFILIVT